MTTEERDFQARVVHALRRPMTEEEVWEASIAPEDGDPVTEVLRLRAKLEQVTRRGIQLERQVRADHGEELPAVVRDNPPRLGRMRWQPVSNGGGFEAKYELAGIASVVRVRRGAGPLWHWTVGAALGSCYDEQVSMRVAGFAAKLLGLVHEVPLLPGEWTLGDAGAAVEVPHAAT